MPAVNLSVCVPSYRSHEPPNVPTLAAAMPAALDGLEGELVIALNGITANDAGVPEGTRTVDLGINRGVSKGWNAAARAADGDVLCFANDDLELGRGALRLLWEALERHPEAGVVGPIGTHWDIDAGRHLEWLDLSARPPGHAERCEVISGFCFATRRTTWEAVGGFDEFYTPCSWEEVDFCTAVRRRLGLECYAIAGVEHRHEFGVSARQPPWRRVRFEGRSETLRSIHRRNRRHFLAKWSATS